MKSLFSTFSIFAIVMIAAAAAQADVKVKSKQTVSGQTYETATYIKGKRQRSESMGGMVSITQCDLRRSVSLNSGTQTYMVTPFATTTQTTTTKTSAPSTDSNGVVQTGGGRITTTVTTKDTGERKQMFGFTARRLIITIETVSSPDACTKSDSKMQTDGWYIDAAFALDCDYGMSGYAGNYNKSKGCQDKYDVKTIGVAKRGFPVYEKTTMFGPNGAETFTMINEVVEFSQATLDQALFEVPQGYREVSDTSQMYAMPSTNTRSGDSTFGVGKTSGSSEPANSGMASNVSAAAKNSAKPAATLGPKKPGIIRIGIAPAKTGAVGEGITASDLAAAVQNTLSQFLKTPKVEVVLLEAKLPAAIDSEAQTKECDFVAHLTTSHKKGGGGFGMFKALAPAISSVVPVAAAGSTGGYIAGTVASQAVITAADVSGQVKNKDELTLDLKLAKPAAAPVIERSFKAKAKSNGDDIISQVVEQAAQLIVDTVGK